jgi:U3 small nucleolar RNA-associated protein 15
MSAFKRTRLTPAPPSTTLQQAEASEARYWSRVKAAFSVDFASPVVACAFGPGLVRGADGAPTHRLAICAGLDVKVLSIRAGRAVESAKSRSVGKLKDVAQSVSWRRDGRLLCVGDGKGSVHVVDAQTGATLRRLSKGHELLCRDACFLRSNDVVSCSDDKSIVAWDSVTGQPTKRIKDAHEDVVKSICEVDGLVASCGYDGLAKLWDLRTGGQAVRQFHHRGQCEVIRQCGSSLFATAGGNDICVWDSANDRAPVHRFRDAHARSVGALCVDADEDRLITAGLDGLVKVHSLRDHTTVARAAARYAHECLCVAVAPENRVLVVGTARGLLDVRAREEKKHKDRKKTLHPPGGTFRHFNRGQGFAPGASIKNLVVVGSSKTEHKRLAPHDEALRKFRYGDALDEALRTRDPTIVVSVLDELERRGVRRNALQRRDEKRLEPVLAFVAAHVAHPRYAESLTGVAAQLADLYGDALGAHPALDELFAKISQNVASEASSQKALLGLSGAVGVLLAENDARSLRLERAREEVAPVDDS